MASQGPKRTSAAVSHERLDDLLDDALKGTFPASDPVAITVDANAAAAPQEKQPARSRPAARRRR